MDAARKRLLSKYVDMTVWEQGKARARELAKESAELDQRLSALQWAWADLCVEVIPEYGGRGGLGVEAAGYQKMVGALLDAWIDEYQFPYSRSYLIVFRRTVRAWPRARRCKASFHVHHLLSCRSDRFQLIRDDMAPKEAAELVGHKPRNVKLPSTALERAAAVQGWARSLKRMDPEPTEDLISAVADAWYAVTELIDRFGILDEMFAEYEEGGVELAAA